MYNNPSVGKVQVQASTDGGEQLPEKFPDKLNKMFRGLNFIRSCIDDLLIITKGDWSNKLEKLERTLQKLKKGLKCNIEI